MSGNIEAPRHYSLATHWLHSSDGTNAPYETHNFDVTLEATSGVEEGNTSFAVIRQMPLPATSTYLVRGFPEFGTDDILREEDFYPDGSYALIPDGGYLLQKSKDNPRLPRAGIILLPSIFNSELGELLADTLSDYYQDEVAEQIRQMYDKTHCAIPSSTEGSVVFSHNGHILLTLSPDETYRVNPQLNRRETMSWNDLGEYRIAKRAGTEFRFESVVDRIYSREGVDGTIQYASYVISGFDFRSYNAKEIIEAVNACLEGESLDEEAARKIVKPYIRLVPMNPQS